jgi:hypothetical protein
MLYLLVDGNETDYHIEDFSLIEVGIEENLINVVKDVIYNTRRVYLDAMNNKVKINFDIEIKWLKT